MRLDFGEVLGQAWHVTWRFKVLWFFGILASCGRGGSNNNNSSDSSGFGPQQGSGIEGFQMEELAPIILIICGVLLLVLLLTLIVMALNTVGRLGLVRGTMLADQGAASLSFAQLFEEGKPFFWRSFWLNLLVGLAFFVFIVAIVFAFVFFGVATAGFGLILIIPLICILIPIGFFVAIYLEQVNLALVIEDIGIGESFGKGWKVLRNNFGSILVMGLILVIGYIIALLVISFPMILILAPFLIGDASGVQEILAGGAILSLLLCLAYLPILLILNGFVETYRQSAWALSYLRLTGHESSLPELEAGTA